MEPILITRRAVEMICEQSRTCKTETGGVLIGTTRQPVILVAGGPGPRSRKTVTAFTSDSAHDRQVLQEASTTFQQHISYLGHWHKHPPGMPRPSSGDLTQARRLLADFQAKGERAPWMLSLIVQVDDATEPAVHSFRLVSGSADFEAVPLEVIAETDSRLQSALAAEPTYLYDAPFADYWIDPNFSFQRTPTGRHRLEVEKNALEAAGYDVTIRQRKPDERVALHLVRGVEQWLCVLPREYPLGMPRLFRMPEQLEVYPWQTQPLWNSDLLLAHLIARAAHPLPVRRAQGSVPARRTSQSPLHVWQSSFLVFCLGILLGAVLQQRRSKVRRGSLA